MDTRVARHGRCAIHGSSGLYHVYLFIAAHTGNLAIVFHSNEQAASVGIGKGREGARNLACIGDFVLEILLLMFALGDKTVKHFVELKDES